MLKKITIALGAVLFLFLAAAIIIPLAVDVDKYRPQIVQTVNQQLNGRLELGKLSLSLWGQIRIEVAGVNLSDSAGRKVVSVKNAYFHLPFTSLFAGAPILTFKMIKPELLVVKDRSGKLNLMTLMKNATAAAVPAHGAPSAPATPSQATPAAPQSPDSAAPKGSAPVVAAAPHGTPAGGGSIALPLMAARARLGIEMRSAHVLYRDASTGSESEVRDFNFLVKDISLSRPTELEIWADLESSQGKTFHLDGPIKITAEAKPELRGTELDHVDVRAKADFDGLEIKIPGAFEKRKGVVTNVELALTASPREATIKNFVARFFNAEIHVEGKVTNLTSADPSHPASPAVDVNVRSNTIDLKPWVELIPPLKDFELAGAASLQAAVSGPSEKLNYQAKLKVENLTAKSPMLKQQPRFDLSVSVLTDQVENLLLTMKAPGNDLSVQGKIVSFLKPRVDFNITSPGMDLDQLIDFSKMSSKKSASLRPLENEAWAAAAPPADFDAMLDSLRKNEMMKGMALTVGTNIKFIKAYGASFQDINSKIYMKGLQAGIESFTMKAFDGSIKATLSANLEPKMPTYKISTQIEGLDLRKAVESQMALFKNTLYGKAAFSMNAQGSSFNPDRATQNLQATGKLRVDHATFATIDVGRMVAEGLNGSVEKVAQKVPALRGRKVSLPGKESKYEYISSDFMISGGKFNAPNFMTKAEPNAGIDLKGATAVGLKDFGLKANWEVIDTYDLTRAKSIGVDISGTHVEPILAEKGQPMKLPINVGGTLTQPVYSYTEVPEYLAKVAMNNITGAASGRAKAEAQKKVQEALKQNAPPQVQDAINRLGKKLFH